MNEIKTTGIVLKTSEYKDSGRMLTIFSLERGLIYAKINGVLKPKAKLAFAAQPFCFGEFILVSKVGYTVINCTSLENFFDITKNFDKFIAGEGALEAASIIARQEEPNPELFVLLLKALKVLNFSDAQPLTVFIKFFIEALRVAGFGLMLDRCAICGEKNPQKERFSFDHGGRVCVKCDKGEKVNYRGEMIALDSEGLSLSGAESAILKTINESDFEKLCNLHIKSVDNLASATKILLAFFQNKTGEQLKGILEYL